MPDIPRERLRAAMRECDRLCSGVRPSTMREQLATLTARTDLDALHDFYGDGPVHELETHVAGLLGTEAAVFFPTGTMAQQVALRFGADRTGNPTVALHPLGHQMMHERHAFATLTGLRPVWSTTEPRNPTVAEVVELDEDFASLVLELPLRDAGFVLPTWDELVAVCAAGQGRGARVHLDGARIWDSTPYLGHTTAEIAALADSTYVSFYKSLGGFSGAMLAGTGEFAAYARAWRHRYGGTAFQSWPAVLAARTGLERQLPRIPDYVRHAHTVAAALAALPGARVYPDPPHTHQFRLWLPHSAHALDTAVLELAARSRIWFVGGWREAEVPGMAMTEVTVHEPALDWTAADIAAVGERFLALVPQ